MAYLNKSSKAIMIIIPIQEHYKPDGWLLFLVGQLLDVDFNKHDFSRAMAMLFKELRMEDSSEIIMPPVQSMSVTDITSLIVSDRFSPRVPTTSTFSLDILEWTETQVHEWLVEHHLTQTSHLLTNCDGRSLVYLSKYMKSCRTQQILNLLQEDSFRRTKQNMSLIEISSFQSLMDQQKRLFQTTETSINIKKKDL